MTKKDKELLKEAANLLQGASALNRLLFDRLYERAGDAWQFRSKVDELDRQVVELVASMDVVPNVNPTVGPEEEDEGGMEVAGLA